MRTTFLLGDDGKITVGVNNGDEASFLAARAKIVAAFKKLGQAVPEIKMIGEPEQHSHAPEQVVLEHRHERA